MIEHAARSPFPKKIPRAEKRHAGATWSWQTPVAIRTSGVELSAEFRDYVRARLGLKLGKFAPRIERLSVRFKDINGPRGGVDIVCRVKVVLSGTDSIIVNATKESERPAFDAVARAATRAVRKTLERLPGVRRVRPRAEYVHPPLEARKDAGSFFGRRVGRSAANLELALDRPEKRSRSYPVDTARPGVSATARKAGYGSTARRNAKARTTRATASLEDSRSDRPSRKSTRKSANRAKSGTLQEFRAIRKAHSPKRRATKGKARAAASRRKGAPSAVQS